MRYSVEPKYRTYIKGYGFLFWKTWSKIGALSMEKCILTSKKYWQPMSVNLPQRGLSKKQQKQRVIWLEIRSQQRLQMLPQKKLMRIQKVLHNQQMPKEIYYQKSCNKYWWFSIIIIMNVWQEWSIRRSQIFRTKPMSAIKIQDKKLTWGGKWLYKQWRIWVK